MADIEKKLVGETAISKIQNFLMLNQIETYFNTDDTIPIVDGFIKFDGKDYNVQIKGTRGVWGDHDIERKYFEYVLTNFLVYVIADNIDNGLESGNCKIYYRVLSFDDALKGLKNKTKMKASLFDFCELNNITEFKAAVESGYQEYHELGYKGVSLAKIFTSHVEGVSIGGKIKFEENLIDIKETTIETVKFPSEAKLSIDQSEKYKMFVENIIDEDDTEIPNLGIIMHRRANKLTKHVILSHGQLEIHGRLDRVGNVTINIGGLKLDPFLYELFCDYEKILTRFFKEDQVKERDELRGVLDFIRDLGEFREWLIQWDLYNEKYRKAEVIDYFYYVFKNGLVFVEGKSGILMQKVGDEYIARSNQEEVDNFIYAGLNAVKLAYTIDDGEDLEYIGYTILYSQELTDSFRKCLNFHYINMLENDREQLDHEYLDEQVGMIVYNYLLIYWEYNKSKEMLEKLRGIIERRVQKAEEYTLKINYIQLKRVLKLELTQEEMDYLREKAIDEDILLSLASTVLLERKQEAEQILSGVDTEDLGKFKVWPINYLLEELLD